MVCVSAACTCTLRAMVITTHKLCDITAGTGELDNFRVTAIGFNFNSPVGMFVSHSWPCVRYGQSTAIVQICDVNAGTGGLINCSRYVMQAL